MGKRLQNSKAKKMNRLIDRCDLCGGELMPGKTTLEICRGGELIVIKDVAADVCQQCAEAYLSPQVSERLDDFLSKHHRYQPERYIPVPQYSAAQSRLI